MGARGVVLALALALGGGCDDEPTAPAPARTATAPTAAPRLSAKQREECRDQCEQGQIVAGTSDDAALRACRARCDGQAGVGAAGLGPHEVPSRITRAPANHAR
jgi:hypothetical protein